MPNHEAEILNSVHQRLEEILEVALAPLPPFISHDTNLIFGWFQEQRLKRAYNSSLLIRQMAENRLATASAMTTSLANANNVSIAIEASFRELEARVRLLIAQVEEQDIKNRKALVDVQRDELELKKAQTFKPNKTKTYTPIGTPGPKPYNLNDHPRRSADDPKPTNRPRR